MNIDELFAEGLAPGVRELIDEQSHLAAAMRMASAESELRAGREAELADKWQEAWERYDSVRWQDPALIAPLVRAGALAGIGRIVDDQSSRDEAAALFAAVPQERLGAAELSDWATCLEDQPLSIELHRAAAESACVPVLTLYALAWHARWRWELLPRV